MSIDQSPSTPPPAPAPAPAPRIHTITVLVATVCMLVAIGGLVWGTRPLNTPTQDCGTSFSFLLDGRVDVFVDPSNPPAGITGRQAEANNAEPCQQRAAARGRPAGALVVGGTVAAAAAATIDLALRGLRRYRATHMPPVHEHRPI